jgi:hypothetical protein
VENVKNCENASEELKDKSFRMIVKWRRVIDDWIDEDGEHLAKNYEREVQNSQKSHVKRNNRRRERSSSYSEEKSFSIKQEHNLLGPQDKRNRRRRESPRRGNKEDKYLRKRSNRELYQDDENDSDRSDSEGSDSYQDKKGV